MADKGVIQSLQAEIDSITLRQSQSPLKAHGANGLALDVLKRAHNTAPSEESSAANDDETQNAHDSDAALKRIISLVNVSDRSEKTIRERLMKAGFDGAAIETAVCRAKDYGFIDDARFSEVLVRSRVSQGRGSAGIVRELAEHGIELDSVPGWPYEFPLDYDDELNRALDLLDRKPPRTKNQREGAYRKLMQKGYPSSVASTAARIWSEKVARA